MKLYMGILMIVIIAGLFSCHSPKQLDSGSAINDRNRLEERYWKLIEVNGTEVKPNGGGQHEPHITLKSEQKQVVGNGGCNSFGAMYEINGAGRISFSRIISTKMACDKLSLENQFFQALESTDSFHINGDTLILHKAKMAPLAKFLLVYSD